MCGSHSGYDVISSSHAFHTSYLPVSLSLTPMSTPHGVLNATKIEQFKKISSFRLWYLPLCLAQHVITSKFSHDMMSILINFYLFYSDVFNTSSQSRVKYFTAWRQFLSSKLQSVTHLLISDDFSASSQSRVKCFTEWRQFLNWKLRSVTHSIDSHSQLASFTKQHLTSTLKWHIQRIFKVYGVTAWGRSTDVIVDTLRKTGEWFWVSRFPLLSVPPRKGGLRTLFPGKPFVSRVHAFWVQTHLFVVIDSIFSVFISKAKVFRMRVVIAQHRLLLAVWIWRRLWETLFSAVLTRNVWLLVWVKSHILARHKVMLSHFIRRKSSIVRTVRDERVLRTTVAVVERKPYPQWSFASLCAKISCWRTWRIRVESVLRDVSQWLISDVILLVKV